MRLRLLVATASAALLGACGTVTAGPHDPATGSGQPSDTPAAGPEVLLGVGIVLDDGDGPEFCLGGVMESLPPQCGGPRLRGWDWAAIRDEERAGGTAWTGAYVLTGTYDGTMFALTEPPVAADEYAGPVPREDEDRSLGTPCPEPTGGWRPLDRARTTERTFMEAVRLARGMQDFGELWVDQSINRSEDEIDMNDPALLILNVRVVGDVATAEKRLREIWGGALCVSQGQHTQAELRRIQRELHDTEGTLSISVGDDKVALSVIHDDGTLQAVLDERYGDGMVDVTSALVPVSALGR